MNYIKQLQADNQELKNRLDTVEEQLIELLAYYNSNKFHGVENDYAHVSTDVYPRINAIKVQCSSVL